MVWTLVGKVPHPETTTLGKGGRTGGTETREGTTKTEEGRVQIGLRRNPGGTSIARTMRGGEGPTKMTIGEVIDIDNPDRNRLRKNLKQLK